MRQFELVDAVKAYDPTADEGLLNRAYVYAMKMHGSQLRASGDPYFAHPIQVAGILTDYRLDTATIVTALLHDVVEDTSATRDDIAEMFGEEVAGLVEGVTKLSRLELQAEHTRQAENLRKFILAISKDVRVLLVKLADRLHNMRTLEFVKPEKRERISRETLEVYAPLGRSIGIHRIATELEELAFEHLNPTARTAIERRLEALRLEHGRAVQGVAREVQTVLEEAGIKARVFGREKTPYSIWRKLQRKALGFSALSDIYGFRVILQSEDDCYRALGVIHRAWPMVPERFKDLISTPKSNNYRSLHTTVVGPSGLRIEMQIRTEAMDRVAEEGVAAHWRYKNKSYGFDREAMEEGGGRDPLLTLRHLVQVIEHGEGGEDWVEHAKLEMYLDQVFVFTPKGSLITLPRGAMALDFAYAVHTEVGDSAVGVKINGELKPMRTPLQNGDVVEIIRGAKPDIPSDWRSLTVTGRARSAIRRHIRLSEREEFQKLGRAALDQALARVDKEAKDVSLKPALETLAIELEEDLFEQIGRGQAQAGKVVGILFPKLKASGPEPVEKKRIESGSDARLYVRGGGLRPGVSIHFGACCSPVPGDRIVGIIEPGQGLTVHTIDCNTLADFADDDSVWTDLQWTPQAEQDAVASTRLVATMRNAPGVLGQVATVIGEAGGNILNLNMTHRQQDFFDMEIDVEVADARHATQIIAALRANPSVDTVERARG
ncbi:bifunctional (p)ppGpp synthetase/guanosine-3',5'-bis(diphosphate) 3'-pyrophosphohydrolase [Brevundimonas sp. BAL450]|uniref:GTP pyrophosphokinase rsh n=1 Tax=Brevundimonas abyssalis TAR-001 TaxID=1391729 RepID=A0A8E0TS56_9CAUL|nr:MULTISPECIES: bifunctional (p)ppGpp synthetase/guanosine-3',5'-bis(diphosphate) 3'-pyrophosphohydrolase [Brevundimonas]MBG7615681.1 bifunctional (p)ppGpp synthetase/guanosine-3',5'-bis(diphosphate) 3'-pyrophosphohydrolase [Brevundimonas sp. BAL450]GAD60353.1 GTP pyrophosphokinase, (p)ppGpp synthetase II / guanosine-3',5'-bis(diphosphate) 3'-pyrophosphohydrolase [Brevundimonas abyssalis TAR-001]